MAKRYKVTGKLGTGSRFRKLVGRLAKRSRPKVKNPNALAAYIGRKKYGVKKFASLGVRGRKK